MCDDVIYHSNLYSKRYASHTWNLQGGINNTETWSANLHMTETRLPWPRRVSESERPKLSNCIG